MRTLFIIALIGTCALFVNAQKVRVGRDPGVDLTKYKTYMWAPGKGTANPIIQQTIIDAVDRAMSMKGLTKMSTGAEMTVVMFTAIEPDMHISNPSWYPGLNSIATGVAVGSQSWPVTKGTLVVDISDSSTKNNLWRGTATDTLNQGPTGNMAKDAKSVEKVIKKAVEKMFKQYPSAANR